MVHGDIRHLENFIPSSVSGPLVHGDIRHLEILLYIAVIQRVCSWRHTPFRNAKQNDNEHQMCSWRHTPFRKRMGMQ